MDVAARRIRHYRYVEERMMRMLGGWIALTPELEAKLLFGRHVWDCAQHADLWGRRRPAVSRHFNQRRLRMLQVPWARCMRRSRRLVNRPIG